MTIEIIFSSFRTCAFDTRDQGMEQNMIGKTKLLLPSQSIFCYLEKMNKFQVQRNLFPFEVCIILDFISKLKLLISHFDILTKMILLNVRTGKRSDIILICVLYTFFGSTGVRKLVRHCNVYH